MEQNQFKPLRIDEQKQKPFWKSKKVATGVGGSVAMAATIQEILPLLGDDPSPLLVLLVWVLVAFPSVLAGVAEFLSDFLSIQRDGEIQLELEKHRQDREAREDKKNGNV